MTDVLDPAVPETGGLLAGRYRLVERVGIGGMGRVYRARDEVLHRDVAVKLFHTESSDESDAMRKVAEARVLASLNHPSLVTLFDAHVEQGDHSYLVMEFVAGATLRTRLEDGPLSLADAVDAIRDLSVALSVVHAAGIVHRDVKPSNVLLRADITRPAGYHCVLADFGVAHLMDAARLTSPGLVMGTAAYLAPEQVRGAAPTPASDIYSLGLMMLEAMTGRHPFGLDTVQGSLIARLTQPAEVPEGIGGEWRSLLRAMTDRDPEGRPTAREIAEGTPWLETTGAPTLAPARDPRPAAAPVAAALIPTQPMTLPMPPPPIPATTGGHRMRGMRLVGRTRRPWLLGGAILGIGMAAASLALALVIAFDSPAPADEEVGPSTPVETPLEDSGTGTEPAVVEPEAPVTQTDPAPVVDPAVDPAPAEDNPNKGPGNNNGSNGNGNGNGNSGKGNSGKG